MNNILPILLKIIAILSLVVGCLTFSSENVNLVFSGGFVFLAYAAIFRPKWVKWLWWVPCLSLATWGAMIAYLDEKKLGISSSQLLEKLWPSFIPQLGLILLLVLYWICVSVDDKARYMTTQYEISASRLARKRKILLSLGVVLFFFCLVGLSAVFRGGQIILFPNLTVLAAFVIVVAGKVLPRKSVLIAQICFPIATVGLIIARLNGWLLLKAPWEYTSMAQLVVAVSGFVVAIYYQTERNPESTQSGQMAIT